MRKTVDEVRDALETLLEEHRRAGTRRLPPERVLARDLGASRNTVGKALAELVEAGELVQRQGSGTYLPADFAETERAGVGVLLRNAYAARDPHFSDILDGIAPHAAARGVPLHVIDRVGEAFAADPERNRVMRQAEAGVFDGILFISRIDLPTAGRLAARVPSVFVNHLVGTDDALCVLPDDTRGFFLLTRHLLDLGHRRIALAVEDFDRQQAIFARSGYLAALASADPAPAPIFLETRRNEDCFRRRVKRFFETHRDVTAVCARADRLAARLIRRLDVLGRRVPEDVAVAGAGRQEAGLASPLPLTTIDPRWDEVGRIALDMLEARRRGETVSPPFVLVPPVLIERESTCPST